MKANVPEKIYLTPLECMAASCQPKKDNTIEYIRTDVFIDYVCAWLDENLIYHWEQLSVDDTAELLDDFKNYMKGE